MGRGRDWLARQWGEFAVAPGGEEVVEGAEEAADGQPEQNALDTAPPHAGGGGDSFHVGEELCEWVHVVIYN